MNEAHYTRRLQEFDGLMKEYHNNPIVHTFAKQYARCEIVTKEETLFQMVKALCKNLDDSNRRLRDEIIGDEGQLRRLANES